MSEQVQHSDPALSQAATQILSAAERHAGDHPVSVFVLRGPLQRAWSAQYTAQGVAHVVETTLANLATEMAADTSGARKLVHVTDGLPAETLTEAQDSTRTLTQLADLVVFTPQCPERQRVEGLLTSWPSFWGLCFLSEGFVLQDTVRPAIWNTPSAHWDVLQGLVLFAPADTAQAPAQMVDYAHPSQIDVQLATIEEFKNTLEMLTTETTLPTAAQASGTQTGDSSGTDSTPLQGPIPALVGAEGFSRISLAQPKRYAKADYERKLFNETNPWWRVALRHPWKVGFWNDLWRLQRRLKRRAGQ